MRTSNPALRADTFEGTFPGLRTGSATMTIEGTVNKTGILLVLVVVPAFFVWRKLYAAADPSQVVPWLVGGLIGALVLSIATIVKKEWAPRTAPLYAIAEGLVLGGISAAFERSYPGIVVQAVLLTFGTLFALLIAYKAGLVRATEKFRLIVGVATGSIVLFYLVALVLSLFGVRMGFLHEGGKFGILFSLFVVAIAALNLVLDFDFIERGAQRGAPKFMEWYAAFGLMVTLIWLYLEVLRLLAKTRRR